MKYPLIIFDWDGTLMDSIDKIVTCVKQAAILTGLEAPSSEAIRNIIGLSLDVAMIRLFPSLSLQGRDAMVSAYRQQYIDLNQQQTPFYSGIREWLFSLREQGYLLAVATGKGRGGLDRMLQEYNVKNLFSATYCADETISKPHPLMINKILEDLNMQSHQALMVGDSSYDLEMANNANVDCVGVTYGVHSHQTLSLFNPIALLDDLPKQLGQYI
ncbi:HAD family hydrolase [Psychromonas antarctica]|uniref:HAD family hydrolase n=1 Tax=Psychromonas antarctica TaxID=67573 RepID=UPI001EE8DBF7|nr:HAD-IA family hydrolase [Psychromonas antarctica]MCG6200483.1 HAD-IA family hydrolase [Psychromonas antarctica]